MVAMLKKYDLAFSLGFSCGGTMALRRANLQFASYPLDWIGSPGIVQSAEMVASDFAHWLEKDDLQLVAVRGGSFQNNVYQSVRTRFGFPHDFSRFYRLEDIFDQIKAKYERRIVRFIKDVSGAKTALVVYVGRAIDAALPDADLIRAREILMSRFPQTQFDLVYFYQKDSAAYEEREVAEGIRAVACNYKTMEYGEVSHATRPEVMAEYLNRNFTVLDVRSAAEKAAYAKSVKARKRKFDGFLTRIKYRLYRRWEEELQQKGLVPRDFPLWFK